MIRARDEKRITTRYAHNILALYLDADETTRAAGAAWYELESLRCEDSARRLGVSADAVAGAAAAISPGMQWEHIHAYVAAIHDNPKASVPTYSREFVRRAYSILHGAAVLSVLSGPKVTAFYMLLSRRDMDAVVIDGHALNIARHDIVAFRRREDYSPPAATRVTTARYRRAATAYREIAELVGVAPHAVQATTWIHWRNLIRVKS